MITAQQLPPARSVYEAPPLLPGEELTPQQQQQFMTAQIASVVTGVAAAKNALRIATTNQIVALLHGADLLSEAGIAAFANSAATLVRYATRQAQELTWTGTKMRTEIVGVSFDEPIPDFEQLAPKLRFGRETNLTRAYRRVAEEYRDNLQRTPDDPIIQEIVRQFEQQAASPLKRVEDLTSDATPRKEQNGKAEWQKTFQEAVEGESRTDPAPTLDEKKPRVSVAERRRAARERQNAELEEYAAAAEAARAEREKRDADHETAGPGGTEENEDFRLGDAEVESIIERYAEQKAGERAERMVSQDIQGASRNIYNKAINAIPGKQVLGFRRVIHPELSQSGTSCGLCIVASTHEYTKRDLLPIHAGCNCEVVEIYSLHGEVYDPGHLINLEDLDVFYREAGDSTHGWDLKKHKYEVVEHPEYGPTLVNAHPNKRGNIKKEHVILNG